MEPRHLTVTRKVVIIGWRQVKKGEKVGKGEISVTQGGTSLKYNINKKLAYIIIIVVILSGIGVIAYTFKESQSKYFEYLDYRDELLGNSVKNVVGIYEQFSNFAFKTIIDKKEIKRTGQCC